MRDKSFKKIQQKKISELCARQKKKKREVAGDKNQHVLNSCDAYVFPKFIFI